MNVCNLFVSSHKWMRRSSWAPGLKSRGWRAAVEEPRPVIQVLTARINWLTVVWNIAQIEVGHTVQTFLKAVNKKNFIAQPSMFHFEKKQRKCGGLFVSSLAQISHDDWSTLNIWISCLVPARFYGKEIKLLNSDRLHCLRSQNSGMKFLVWWSDCSCNLSKCHTLKASVWTKQSMHICGSMFPTATVKRGE